MNDLVRKLVLISVVVTTSYLFAIACGNGDNNDDRGCGNEAIDIGEECDGAKLNNETCETKGYESGALACLSACAFDYSGCVESSDLCGNDVREGAEECDGEDLDRDCFDEGFDYGEVICTADCKFDTSDCALACGDGEIDVPEGEECDGADLDDYTCEDFGFTGGVLACGSLCEYDTSGCVLPDGCGDGMRVAPEECDGTEFGASTCVTEGFESGTLACGSDCRFDTSGCVIGAGCGDGMLVAPEECDGANLDGKTCMTEGWDMGMLACGSDCRLDLSDCSDVDNCGNNMIDGLEDCDGTAINATCMDLGFTTGTLGCSASCAYDTTLCVDIDTPFADYCDQSVDAQAAAETACGHYSSGARSTAEQKASCLAKDGAFYTYDPAAAAACLAAWAASGGACAGAYAPPVCAGVLTPAVVIGGACYGGSFGSAACIDSYCDRTGNVCPGSCAALVAAGGTCSSSSECVDGAFCDSGMCATESALGAACTTSSSCIGNAVCDLTTMLCRARVDYSEACDADNICRNFQWVQGAWVDVCVNGICTGGSITGEPCVLDGGCSDGSTCKGVGPGLGTCTALAATGEACGAVADCMTGDYCTGGVCTTDPAPGEACGFNNRCADGAWCRYTGGTSQCDTLKLDGEDCSQDVSNLSARGCVAGYYCLADGLCHAPGGVGDVCVVSQVETCADPLFCQPGTGLCSAAVATGEACLLHRDREPCQAGFTCLCDANDISCRSLAADRTGWSCGVPLALGVTCWNYAGCEDGSRCFRSDGGVCEAVATSCVAP